MSPGRKQISSTSEEGRSRKLVRSAYGVPARERSSFCYDSVKKKNDVELFLFSTRSV